jgi:TniQ
VSAPPSAPRVLGARPLRTLPLRLTPQPGEALDSWLEAFAARANTTWGDMTAAVGIHSHDPPSTGISRRNWLVGLTPTQLRTLTLATGVDTALVEAMTLEPFRRQSSTGPGVEVDRAPLRWLHSYVSRYCPGCLAETGGRWQSWWRLKWAFACPKHLCLLADVCPACQGVQRHRDLPADLIPTPGRCARKAPAARGRSLDRCAARLWEAPVVRLAVGHPALHAQRVMLDANHTDVVSYGIYAQNPLPVEAFLNDVRAVGRRVLVYADIDNLHRYVPADLIALVCGSIVSVRATPPQPDRPQTMWASAPIAAAATIAALSVLSAATITDAGDRLHDLITNCRDRGLSVSASNIGWGRRVSRTLIGVQLRALAPFLSPTDQLRHKLSTELPTRPDTLCRQTTATVRNAPALLWLAVSARFVHPHIGTMQLRSALSVAVSVVGTRFTLAEAARQLGSVTTAAATSRVLQILHTSRHWPAMLAALIRLAGHLDENPPPIDYSARRTLSYDDVLPDTEWALICRDTGTPPGRGLKARVVRCWMYERLSGSPGCRYPTARHSAEFRAKLAEFPCQLTPELLYRLDMSCRRFLDNHGLAGQPTTWYPPTDVLNNLDLPGIDPAQIEIAKLRDLLRDEHLSVCKAAQKLNTPPTTLLYLLETAPLPMDFSASQRRARGAVFFSARTRLPKTDLLELYQRQHRSLADIGRLAGVSRQTITRLTREYDIPTRPPHRPARTRNGLIPCPTNDALPTLSSLPPAQHLPQPIDAVSTC